MRFKMGKTESLRDKTLNNMIWKMAERIGAQVVSFIVQLVLARLLMPEEFGLIAIVNVAITLCNVFITNGLGTSLVQKKDADALDFSSVFIFNFGLSTVVYIVLFFLSPLIAKFYDNMLLTPVIRVLGIQLFFSGIKTVQQAIVARQMQFKLFFAATFVGTFLSGIIGVVLAYVGAGVWALVVQYLSNSAIDVVCLFVAIDWKPSLKFSLKRLKPLFQYGWKLLVASLINNIYEEIRTLIIGKKYTNQDLAFYNRGKQFPDLICNNTMVSIESVLFPVMTRFQDRTDELKRMLRRFIRISSYIMSPLMMGLAVVAKPLVVVLLTEKWLFCVPYIQIYCIVGLLRPMQTANQQMVKAIGRSDITIKIEIIKKLIGLLILLVAMEYGVIWIALSNILYSLIVLIINAFPSKKLINYSFGEQFVDLLPATIASVVMACVIYPLSFGINDSLLLLLLQIILGILTYILISVIFRIESFRYLINLAREKWFHK